MATKKKTPGPDTGTLPGTALETLGSVFEDDHGRDAIHLATIAITAAEKLFPGQDVGLTNNGEGSAKVLESVGIVDPFIKTVVQPGQRFWLVLYPRTITSLRHEWTHPVFDDHPAFVKGTPDRIVSLEKQAAEQALTQFAMHYDYSLDELIEALDNVYDEYFTVYGTDASGEIPQEVYDNFRIYMGREPKGKKAKYFSCSC